MKIIFLDIDGVLNDTSMESILRRIAVTDSRLERTIHEPADKQTYDEEILKYEAGKIDEEKVSNLNTIIEKTGAKVVISSSWRYGQNPKGLYHGRKPQEMASILKRCGFKGEVIGQTPKLYTLDGQPKPRGDEIKAYLDACETKPTHIVIIDDGPMSASPETGSISNWWVNINAKQGLTDYEVNWAVYCLNTDWPNFICCSVCNAACSGGHSSTVRGDVETFYCPTCALKQSWEEYEKTKLITSHLTIHSAIDEALGRTSPISGAMKEINDEVSKFDNEVWYNGLAQLVRDTPSALKGSAKKITVMALSTAGRVLITLERGDDYVTLIQVDEDLDKIDELYGRRPRMGLQGITATKETALELISTIRKSWGTKSLKIVPDKKVSIFGMGK